MPKTVAVQTNFASGELSPSLRGRTDLPEYRNGAETIENFITLKQGGALFRSGTSYVADVKDSAVFTRLVSFIFSVTQTYILEFGDLYIRFYRDSGQLKQVSGDPSEGTITEVVSPYTTAQLRALKFTQSADILYITHPDHEPRELRRTAGNDTDPTTWTLATFDMQDGPYLKINTTSTTFKASALTGSVTITASSKTGVNGGDGFKTSDIGRLIRMTSEDSLRWGWLEITAFTSTTVVTATVKNTLGLNGIPNETTTDWRLGAWGGTRNWPWTANFHQQRLWFGGTDDQPQRLDGSRVGDFNQFGPTKNDEVIARDSDGLTFIISDNQVNAIRWLASAAQGILVLTEGGPFLGRSSGGQFDPITPTNFGITAQTNYGAHETVRPYRAGEAILMPLTAGRKIRELVFRRDDDQIVGPDMTALANHITAGGLLDSAFQEEPGGILWLVRNDGVLLGLTYEREAGVIGWHRHILGGTLDGSDHPEVESIAGIREGDDDQLWMTIKRTVNGSTKRFVEFMKPQFKVDTNKELAFMVDAGLTLDDRKTITDVQTRNPVVITSTAHGFSNGDRVRLRAIRGVKTVPAGSGLDRIETKLNDNTYTVANKAADSFELRDADGNNIDGSGFTTYISGGSAALEVSTISNLDHLEGETVAVFGDGGEQAQRVVANGSITLENNASLAAVGLAYTGTIKTMPLIPTETDFDPRAGLQRIQQVLLVLDQTLGGKAGVDGSLDELVYREVDDPMDESVPLFSGIQELGFDASTTREATVTIQQTSPQPMNVLAVVVRMTIDDV